MRYTDGNVNIDKVSRQLMGVHDLNFRPNICDHSEFRELGVKHEHWQNTVEVYFKEAKQYLGFLKEQSNHYAAYVASVHLTAMRFCMLVIAKSWHPSSGIADMRQQLTANATAFDYATRLWLVFRAVIAGALDEMNVLLGDASSQVMATIERHVQSFFVQSLQLDVRTLRLEAM